MMCQGNRLRFLQMRKARHIGMEILFHNMIQCFQKMFHQMINLLNLISHIKLHIQSHLIITASSCMQFFACVADSVNQICLHKTVNIFVFAGNLKFTFFHISHNRIQSLDDFIFLLIGQYPLFRQHRHMCLTSTHILMKKLLVKTN